MKWQKKQNKLVKKFEFKNFLQAIEFVNKVAKVAEELNHHPDIKIHDYKFVTVESVSHEEGAVTDKDYKLAERIDDTNKNAKSIFTEYKL